MKDWQGAGFRIDIVECHWGYSLHVKTGNSGGILVVALPIFKGIFK